MQIIVLDAAGALVTRFSSADASVPLDLAKIDAAPEWLAKAAPPSATAGQHRFVWDLHYAAPPAPPGGENEDGGGATGVWAPPGRYTVELTVDGRSLRQPLEVRPDPRVKVDDASFKAEFVLAKRIEHAQEQVRAALAQATILKSRLKAEAENADPAQKSALERSTAQLDALVDQPADDPRNSVGQPPKSSTGLNDIAVRLAKLSAAVDGADGGPTADAVSGVDQARAALELALANLQSLSREGHVTN